MTIQWFPGHMVKAKRLISESLKQVDAICEVIDARIPASSRNPDLDGLTGTKPRLVALNRVDQADPAMTKLWGVHFKDVNMAVIETDCKSGKGTAQLQDAVSLLLADKIASYKAKGQSGRALRLMVVGIPNVGKSSLINRAAKRKAAQTSDRPGVTRGKQWIKLGNGIELLDTPGVLWPKFEDRTVAENLAFTGAIRDEILDTETLGARLMVKLSQMYPDSIARRYKISVDIDVSESQGDDDLSRAGFELLSRAAAARGFLVSKGEVDTERMAIVLLDEFRAGTLGRITLEQPE